MEFNSGFKGLIKLQFSQRIFENIQISNFMKICPMGDELSNAERRTDGRTWRS